MTNRTPEREKEEKYQPSTTRNELENIMGRDEPEEEVDPKKTPIFDKLANKLMTHKSIILARKLGYVLLVISLVDFIFILVPPDFLNPVWEYKVIGDIIKLVPLPMISLLLIFAGERTSRKKFEKLPLKILSWFSLVIAIFFFLLLPLIITDYVRIDKFNNSQITSEINLQKKKLNATQEQLQQMDAEQIQNLVPRRNQEGNLGAIPDSPEKAKATVVENIERAKEQADERAAIARSNVTLNLVKNTVKLFLQSLLAGCLYVLIWTSTKWARSTKSKRRKRA